MPVISPQPSKPSNLPPSHEHAWDLLIKKGFRLKRILHVGRDYIFYERPSGEKMTAWLYHRKDKLELSVEEGFPAEPSEGKIPLDADVNLPPDPTNVVPKE